MKRLSTLHPNRFLKPGRYMLDEEGVLWTPLVDLPLRMVAAVVVLAPGELTRRQRAIQPIAPTDDDRAVADKPVDIPVETPLAAVVDIRADCAAEAAEREARFREAKRLTVAHPSVVSRREPDAPLRSLARRERPTPVQGVKALLDGVAEDEEAFRELQARVKAKRDQRAKRAPAPAEPRIDGKRVAAAYRAKTNRPAPAPKAPTRRALGAGECTYCGIPGFRGCDHFLPFEGHET